MHKFHNSAFYEISSVWIKCISRYNGDVMRLPSLSIRRSRIYASHAIIAKYCNCISSIIEKGRESVITAHQNAKASQLHSLFLDNFRNLKACADTTHLKTRADISV